MEKRQRGRPRTLPATVRKTTVAFEASQIAFLDRISIDIMERSMIVLDRGTLLRALVEALRASALDLSSATSEGEVKELVLARLQSVKEH